MLAIDRRTMLRLLASPPLAADFTWTEDEAAQVHQHAPAARAAAKPGTLFKPTFFTAHEYATVRVLVDIVMPKDERSGSATDVGVPEFMDLIVNDQPARKVT